MNFFRERCYGVVRATLLVVGITVLIYGIYGGRVAAQDAPSTIPTIPVGPAPEDANQMSRHREWDKIIDGATSALAASPAPSPRNALLDHYYRGNAFLQIGLLDEALADFQTVVEGWKDHDTTYDLAQARIDTIKAQIAVRPPIHRDVTIDGHVLFTIYADADDIALEELVDLAPVAANAVRSLTGEEPRRTVLMLFESDEHMAAFNEASHRTQAWDKAILAEGGAGGVEIRLTRQGFKYNCNPRSPYYRFTIAHEYMHVIVQRVLEWHRGLPIWLSEGVANAAGGHCAPAELSGLSREFHLMVENNKVETLDEMSGRHFYDTAFATDAVAASQFSYAQATSMTTYLLLGRRESIIGDLLQALRQTNDFPTAFQQTFGESVEEFYADWSDYALPKKKPQTAPQ